MAGQNALGRMKAWSLTTKLPCARNRIYNNNQMMAVFCEEQTCNAT